MNDPQGSSRDWPVSEERADCWKSPLRKCTVGITAPTRLMPNCIRVWSNIQNLSSYAQCL